MVTSEINYDSGTIVDLENDSITPEVLLEGETAHDATGASIRGTMRTVPDSEMLGGYPPSYYLPAVNSLDDPDFAIAQAGYGGLHGNTRYAADRWPVNSGSIIPAKTNNGFSLTSGGTSANIIWQFLRGAAGDYLAKPFTLGVYTQDGNAYAVHFVFPSVISENFASDVISIGNWKFDVVFFTTRDMPSVRVYTTAANDTIELQGIALLPGTYTADTLPPYVRPDPTLELAKCQQNFVRIKNNRTDGYSILCWGLAESTSVFYPQLTVPIEMRDAVVASIAYSGVRCYYLNSAGNAGVANITSITAESGVSTGTITLTVTVEGSPFAKGNHAALQLEAGGYIDISKDL